LLVARLLLFSFITFFICALDTGEESRGGRPLIRAFPTVTVLRRDVIYAFYDARARNRKRTAEIGILRIEY
jgi:hypothetical protein